MNQLNNADVTVTTTTTAILGGSDPEMEAIEGVLRDCGVTVLYASIGGKRCHPGNAYRADGVVDSGGDPREIHGDVILVECEVTPMDARVIAVCDHHRPGDAGYGAAPDGFWEGSSLGQIVALLAQAGLAPEEWERGEIGAHAQLGEIFNSLGGGVSVCIQEGALEAEYQGQYWPEEDGVVAEIPHHLLLVAASDHCPGQAYQGKCPGIKPEALMRHRAAVKAAFRNEPVEEVLRDVEAAMGAINTAPTVSVDDGCPHWDGHYGECPGGYDPGSPSFAEYYDVHDLRGQHVKELPEAALRMGIAYLADVTERGGRKKVTLGGAHPHQEYLVRKFKAGEIVSGLVGGYGVPTRGYAGAYYPEEPLDKCGS